MAPEDTQQLVQQGGAVLLQGNDILYYHKDTGPLMTARVDEICEAAEAATRAQLPAGSA